MDDLDDAGFRCYKVNYRFNFVNPETGVHTQTIELLRGSVKWRKKKHRRAGHHYRDSYLSEFTWRERIKNVNMSDTLLKSIQEYSPPEVDKKFWLKLVDNYGTK